MSMGYKKGGGGRGGIRTHGGLASSAVFKTAAINQLDHSSVYWCGYNRLLLIKVKRLFSEKWLFFVKFRKFTF